MSDGGLVGFEELRTDQQCMREVAADKDACGELLVGWFLVEGEVEEGVLYMWRGSPLWPWKRGVSGGRGAMTVPRGRYLASRVLIGELVSAHACSAMGGVPGVTWETRTVN